MEVTFLTTELPYPLSHGGIMGTHGVIQALAASAQVSIMVLAHNVYSDAAVRAAKDYYGKTCRSLTCHQFDNLNPSSSLYIKAWHYLSGFPRHGFWNEQAASLLTEHLLTTQTEVLWCSGTHEAKYLPAAKKLGCRTVVTTQNVDSDLRRQEINGSISSKITGLVQWFDLRRLEKMAARWADVTTAITNVDLAHYRRHIAPDRVFLLPFGYPIQDGLAPPDSTQEEANTICFMGSMDWEPNVKAARYLVREVMPLVWKQIPQAKCFLVGRNPKSEVRELSSDKVIVTGTVPSVREYYERAPVMAVPIQGVSGVKIKLIEAMAHGKAIVSTSPGAAGLDVEHRKQVMIADTPLDFANALIELLGDKTKRRKLGDEAHRLVVEHVSPKETQRQVNRILEYLSSKRPQERIAVGSV